LAPAYARGMLAAAAASFAYRPGAPVLRSIDVRVQAGRVTAVIGPNGAGKSTLLRLLVGIVRPASGAITLQGADLSLMTHKHRARRIAYIPQRTSVAFAYTVRQYVALGRYSAAVRDDAGAVDRALARMDLHSRADDPVPELSAGQQQRAAFARALAQLDQRPAPEGTRALLADEPVAAMDPLHAQLSMRVLREQAAAGLAVGVVLHDMSLALRWCDDAVLLAADGRIAAQGTARDVLSPDILQKVFGVGFVRLEDPASAAAAIVPAADLSPL
jgi:iron complex transport system ATP-binding protein